MTDHNKSNQTTSQQNRSTTPSLHLEEQEQPPIVKEDSLLTATDSLIGISPNEPGSHFIQQNPHNHHHDGRGASASLLSLQFLSTMTTQQQQQQLSQQQQLPVIGVSTGGGGGGSTTGGGTITDNEEMTLTSVQQILGTTTHCNHHPTRTAMTSTAQLVMDQQQQGEEYDNAYSDFGGTATSCSYANNAHHCNKWHRGSLTHCGRHQK